MLIYIIFKTKIKKDHGDKKSLYFKKLADAYDLNFPPYLI